MTGRCAHTDTQTHIERTHYLRHSLRSLGGDKYHICEVYIFASQAYNAGSRKTSNVDVTSEPAA